MPKKGKKAAGGAQLCEKEGRRRRRLREAGHLQAEDDTDDGSSAEGKEGDAQESEDGGQVGGGQSNSEVEQTDLGNVGSTVEAFDSARQDMVQQGAKEQHYYDMPSMIKENVVMEPKRVAQSFNRAPDADDDWKRVDRKIDRLNNRSID